jgi:hypothetical protein
MNARTMQTILIVSMVGLPLCACSTVLVKKLVPAPTQAATSKLPPPIVSVDTDIGPKNEADRQCWDAVLADEASLKEDKPDPTLLKAAVLQACSEQPTPGLPPQATQQPQPPPAVGPPPVLIGASPAFR